MIEEKGDPRRRSANRGHRDLLGPEADAQQAPKGGGGLRGPEITRAPIVRSAPRLVRARVDYPGTLCGLSYPSVVSIYHRP